MGPDKGRRLLLNLPSQTLNADEMHKAKKLFAEYGVAIEENPVFDYEGGPVTGTQVEFNMILDGDTEKGTTIAMRIFKEVYGFPDNFNIRIEEN